MTLAVHLSRRPPSVQRMIAIALMVVALLILWSALIEPLRWVISRQSNWRAQTIRTVTEDRAWAAGAAQLSEERRALESSPWWTAFYSHTTNDEDVARLRRDVTNLAGSAGGHIDQVESRGSRTLGRLTELHVRLGTTATIDQLRSLLVQIAAHRPYLRTERLHITSPQSQTKEANALLTVTLDLVAYSTAHKFVEKGS